MEYELLTGPRQGDCGGGDGIHNHTNARKCTKTLEMFPTNKSVTNTGKYSITIAIVGVHSYYRVSQKRRPLQVFPVLLKLRLKFSQATQFGNTYFFLDTR